MVLLNAVRHDGYYFLTLWTVGDNSLCLRGYTVQRKVVNCQSLPLFARVFLLKPCHTKPPSTWCFFILFAVPNSCHAVSSCYVSLCCREEKAGEVGNQRKDEVNCILVVCVQAGMALECKLLTVCVWHSCWRRWRRLKWRKVVGGIVNEQRFYVSTTPVVLTVVISS